MSEDPYSPLVREYFAAPAHAGIIDDGVAVAVESQGVRLELSGTVRDNIIRDLRFKAWGCPHLIAACESFCAGYEGKPVQSLEEFLAADIMQILPVPVEKTGRILVLEDTVRSLGQKFCDASVPA
ncbi:MAG: iron-sulfur cluster assembly scaffold protein [Gammaproteobacteria bacterium]|nr:iron-sulfur cluster assembly scaffold protein [Gammaproteobacteria bacterium]